MTICKKCGANVTGEFCSKCGTKKDDVEVEKFCSRCGKENVNNNLVCTNCAKSLRIEDIKHNEISNMTKPATLSFNQIRKEDSGSLLYYINWGVLVAIIAIFLFCPIIGVSGTAKADLDEYNRWRTNKIPAEWSLYDATLELFESVQGYIEWSNGDSWNHSEELTAIGNKYIFILVCVAFVVLAYLIVIIAYIQSLIEKDNSKEKIITNGKGFCIFTIVMCAASFLLLDYINTSAKGITEYGISPIVLIVVILAIFNWKVVLKKFE